MKNRSIKTILTITMAVICLLSMVIATSLSYFSARKIVLEETLSKTENLVASGAFEVSGWFTGERMLVKTVGSTLQEQYADNRDVGAIKAYCAAQGKLNPQLIDVYIGFSDDMGIFGASETSEGWKATQRPWYKAAMAANGNIVITAPYLDSQTGDMCITVTQYVGKIEGLDACAAVDVSIAELGNIVSTIDIAGNGYAFLATGDGEIVTHPNKIYAPTKDTNFLMTDDAVYKTVFENRGSKHTLLKDYDGVKRYMIPYTVEAAGWTLYAAIPENIIFKSINSELLLAVFVCAAITILAVVIIFIAINNLIAKPVSTLTIAAKTLANGNTSVALSGEFKGELADLRDSFGTMADNIKSNVKTAASLAASNLTTSITPRSEHDEMGIALLHLQNSLQSTIGGISKSAASVADSSRQMANISQNLAESSSEQSRTLDSLTGNITDIGGKITENADKVNETGQLSADISRNADVGKQQMDAMLGAVDEISKASTDISKVIKVIDDIAFQTNILALNAAVEAARAGQHGKGFAVVADEVRSLASKSAEAAKDTGLLIANSMEKAELGAKLAHDTHASLETILTGVSKTAVLIEEISRHTDEQNMLMQSIERGVGGFGEMVERNSAGAEEGASGAAQMSNEAQELARIVAQFKLKSNPADKSNVMSNNMGTIVTDNTGFTLNSGGNY